MATDEGSVGRKVRDVLTLVREAASILVEEPEMFRAKVGQITDILRDATGAHGEIDLQISTNRITVGDEIAYKSESRDNNIAFDLFQQGLRRVAFRPGVAEDEVYAFVARFAECRGVDQIDEDFVSTLWREPLPNIHYTALDGFTEKIFMSEERFVANFRGVIESVMPGLRALPENDEGDKKRRPRVVLDDVQVVGQAEDARLRGRQRVGVQAGETVELIKTCNEPKVSFDHLLGLVGRLMVKTPSPLPDEELGEIIVCVLSGYLEAKAWQGFADAARTLWAVTQAAARLPEALHERLKHLEGFIAGRDLVGAFAKHLDPEQTDFTSWARWFFTDASILTAPDLLTVVNQCEHVAGQDFLKDLLRRQGTTSLDPWVERLRDPNPGVVLEVLDVILGSDLGEQARPLLLESLRHEDAGVRAKAVEGLGVEYDLKIREALLPLLSDPSTEVRQAVVARFAHHRDVSVSPYIASAIKAPQFIGFDDDQQRIYFETLARLGGDRFLEVFRVQLRLDESEGGLARLFRRGKDKLIDNVTRRAAISGLSVLGTKAALNLVREVLARADLELAGHCELALRMAGRGRAADEPEMEVKALERAAPLEDAAAGADRMGGRLLFEIDLLEGEPPHRPRPTASDIINTGRTSTGASYAAEVAIGGRPLLGEDEVFLASDHRRLRAEPGISAQGEFRLTSPRAALVGVEQSAQTMRVTQPVSLLGGAAQIVERRAPRVVQTPVPDAASLEDLLMGYLEVPAKSVVAADASSTPAPRANVDDLLRDFLGGASTEPVPRRTPAPRHAAPPRTPAPRHAAPPPRTPAPRRAAPSPLSPPPSPPSPPPSPGGGLDDLLRGFLADDSSVAPPPVPAVTPAAKPVQSGVDGLLKSFLDTDLGD